MEITKKNKQHIYNAFDAIETAREQWYTISVTTRILTRTLI